MKPSPSRDAWLRVVFALVAALGACADLEEEEESAEVASGHPAAIEPPSPPDLARLWSGSGCTASSCHASIEPIRQPDTKMLQRIRERGREFGDPDGCVVCHGGDASATTPAAAHSGTSPELAAAGGPDAFFADPASPWVNERSCGQCHAQLVAAQWNSLMMTEAGKIQGTSWSFGIPDDYEHRFANYDTQNPDERTCRPSPRLTPTCSWIVTSGFRPPPRPAAKTQRDLPDPAQHRGRRRRRPAGHRHEPGPASHGRQGAQLRVLPRLRQGRRQRDRRRAHERALG